MRPTRWIATTLLLSSCGLAVARPAHATIRVIPYTARVGPARTDSGDGLKVRFKDIAGDSCTINFCSRATDTVTVQTTTMANINYLLNTGSTFGPWDFGNGWFETRWDSYLNIKVPGDYIFSIQVDDGAEVAIGDSIIHYFDGGHWFNNQTSDTIRFEYSGSYPFRAYYFDCPYCCRGFRMGAMGPAGSGMMAWTPGFDFNADLGPCCTYGGNGPGLSVIPAALFFRSPPAVDVAPPAPGPATILRCHMTPNPAHGASVLTVELARERAVWAEVFDGTGRRVATLASGERHAQGTARWVWSPAWGAAGGVRNGTYFYRVRTDDGATASGSIVLVR